MLSKNFVWSISLYASSNKNLFETKDWTLIKSFKSKKIRTSKEHIHTQADPFLFVEEDALYVFYESQSIDCYGVIKAFKTTDLVTFEDLGIILDIGSHSSYPYLFKYNGNIYMIPETSQLGEVSLYKFEAFPYSLKKCKTLINKPCFDSSLYREEKKWFLFTTDSTGLNIFYTDNLEDDWCSHPMNPLSLDSAYSRNGGGIVRIDNELYRVAQDCSGEYGRKLYFMKILELSENNYTEVQILDNFAVFFRKVKAYHHFNSVYYKNKYIIVMDIKQPDYLLNKFIALLFKIIAFFKKLSSIH
jgi:hypothetical protein